MKNIYESCHSPSVAIVTTPLHWRNMKKNKSTPSPIMRMFILPLLFFMILLTGCATVTPRSLGISESQWRQYSPEQRTQLAANYKQTRELQKRQQVNAGNSLLYVNIQGGSVLMPPYSSQQAYQPIAFEIQEGDCHRKVSVISKINPEESTMMSACYTDSILYLDASPYEPDKAYGSILLRFMPVWKRGFTYPRVSTTGLTKLTNVDISVKEI